MVTDLVENGPAFSYLRVADRVDKINGSATVSVAHQCVRACMRICRMHNTDKRQHVASAVALTVASRMHDVPVCELVQR